MGDELAERGPKVCRKEWQGPGTKFDLHTKSTRYQVHPLVVFNILDHYKRRTDGQQRVVGTLLGRKDEEGVVHITNCFPVPHVEKDNQAALPIDFHSDMLALHQRVTPGESVLGWYSTGSKITYISAEMHEVYRGEVEDPVLLTVDVALTDSRLGVRAYTGTTIQRDGKPVVARFDSAELNITSNKAETIGVDALINGIPVGDALDAPATILSDLANLERSFATLGAYVDTVLQYVQQARRGEIRGDPEIGRAIAAALNSIGNVTPETFDKCFSTNIQDMLMIVYLANLTRTQLKLANKIGGLL